MLQDILQARGLIWMLVKRELRSRYAGSNFGALWNIIHPVVFIGIYVVVFSSVMGSRMSGGGGQHAYLVHLTSGIIPWYLFNEIVSRCSAVLVENGSLLKKMAIPEEVLFLSVFITSLLVYSGAMVALIVFLLLLGIDLTWVVVLSFPVMIALGVTALGAGMVLSVMTLLVRDVGQFVQIALQLLFWSLPLVWVPSSITSEKIQFLMGLNPLRGFFTLNQLLFGSSEAAFNPDAYWIILLLPFALFVAGISFLRSHRSEILDAI